VRAALCRVCMIVRKNHISTWRVSTHQCSRESARPCLARLKASHAVQRHVEGRVAHTREHVTDTRCDQLGSGCLRAAVAARSAIFFDGNTRHHPRSPRGVWRPSKLVLPPSGRHGAVPAPAWSHSHHTQTQAVSEARADQLGFSDARTVGLWLPGTPFLLSRSDTSCPLHAAGLSQVPEHAESALVAFSQFRLFWNIGFPPHGATLDMPGLTPPRVRAQKPSSSLFQESAPVAAATPQAKARFTKLRAKALLWHDGLPRLIVDGASAMCGDFPDPGLLFLYIAGTMGLRTPRAYLMAIARHEKSDEKLPTPNRGNTSGIE